MRGGAWLGLVCLAYGARAAEPTTPVEAWTLERALATAERSPELTAAEAGQRAAIAEARGAGRFPDPSLTFATHSVSARQSYLLDVPLPWPGRGARVDDHFGHGMGRVRAHSLPDHARLHADARRD